MRLRRLSCLAAAMCGLGAPALAAGRSVGEALVYEMKQTTANAADLSSLPASVRGQAARNQAAANGRTTTTLVTLSVDRVEAGGDAHVVASYSQSMDGVTGAPAAVFAAPHRFQGVLTADGRLAPAYDPAVPATLDARGMYSEAESQNINGQVMLGAFGDFDAFIAGLAQHPRPKAGEAWPFEVKDAASGIVRRYDFQAAAPGPAGGAPAVTMSADFSGPYSSQKLSATGRYDPDRRLLIDFHEDTSYSSTTPRGATSGALTVDIRLGP